MDQEFKLQCIHGQHWARVLNKSSDKCDTCLLDKSPELFGLFARLCSFLLFTNYICVVPTGDYVPKPLRIHLK